MLIRVSIRYPVFMSVQSNPDFDGPAAYQITVRGAISPEWSDRLESMAINRLTLDDGTIFTILTGALIDQAALSGVLNTLYEMQFTLVTVNKLPLDSIR